MPTTQLPVLRTVRAAHVTEGDLVRFPGNPMVFRVDAARAADPDLMVFSLLGDTCADDTYHLPVGVDVPVDVFTR